MNAELIKLAERYFPERLKKIALADAASPESTEEIRLSAGREAAVLKKSGLYFIAETGECVEKGRGAVFSLEEIRETVRLLCDNSLYSARDKLKGGFLPLAGGHRAGVAGRCVVRDGHIDYITDISSVNIRIAHEVKGASGSVLGYICADGVKNTLIVSPPACGKTTMLRDLARVLGGERYMKKVALIDERGELAAMRDGVPTNDVGELTFVLDACPKYEGMISLLRSASPDVLITDEIGSESDAEAISEAVKSGVSVICSIHAPSVDAATKKCAVKRLCSEGVFDLFVLLSRRNGPGTVEEIRHA